VRWLTQSMSSAPCIITSPPVTTLPCRLLLVVESVHSIGGGLKFRGSSGAAVLAGADGGTAAAAAALASAPAANWRSLSQPRNEEALSEPTRSSICVVDFSFRIWW